MFPALWTLPRYLSNLEEVRRGLVLDHFVLYGHSWGGILAMEYALNYQQRPGDLEHDCRHSVVSQTNGRTESATGLSRNASKI
jgi:pimeloyl-ACP methyl ester carboxylesterase